MTLREAKYILRVLLGININCNTDFDCIEDRKQYNEDLLSCVNDWLKGDCQDNSISEYAGDCMDEPIGIWNAFKIAQYLSKKKII